jgi:hypothetical protein
MKSEKLKVKNEKLKLKTNTPINGSRSAVYGIRICYNNYKKG